ncbi:flagellin N-terminal helical domain-containing protein [Sphingopyxis macrogoltabida]|uniref:Flagellin n=1 Tax=Sphingopyxis macrogoltabida TaxID=33050 RepID=A0AAC9FH27_SPHMC|nr:flagellin [Sphingopyxis macrogoltabida]ALJ15845.1 flagellin-like protein [Sphingopyxis macrogoltabida]AMU92085.1 flagellin-like protein [Sphingopyxis macrogoltabida]
MINAVGNRMTREIARQRSVADQIERTQTQISTQKKLLRASDDVVASRRIATIGTAQASTTTWARNVKAAEAQVAQADTALGTAGNLLSRARELTLSAASASMNPADRASVAAELTAIAEELDSLAATRDVNGEPLFAAGDARTMRFDSDTSFAPVPSAASAFVVGGNPISTALRDAAAAVGSGDSAAIGASLETLGAGIAHVADQRATLGLAAGRLERIGDSLASRSISLSDERSSLEDTDLSVAIAQLNAQNMTLEAAQAAFARINRQTLFDILS